MSNSTDRRYQNCRWTKCVQAPATQAGDGAHRQEADDDGGADQPSGDRRAHILHDLAEDFKNVVVLDEHLGSLRQTRDSKEQETKKKERHGCDFSL